MQSTSSNLRSSTFAAEPTSIATPKALYFLSCTLEQDKYGVHSDKAQKSRGHSTARLVSGDGMDLIEKLAT